VVDATRLAQLTREEASSVFTRSGELQPDVIARSREIINGTQLGNKQLVSELTSNGSNIADWGKYTTPTFRSPLWGIPSSFLLQFDARRGFLRPGLQGRLRGGIAVKALCVGLADSSESDSWMTLNHEYTVLSLLMTPKGPAKLRIVADDGRTPILVEASGFSMTAQRLPSSWACVIREGGVVELGPSPWLEPGFWERYFDGDRDAIQRFQEEVARMET
jgi:hypothetical protein